MKLLKMKIKCFASGSSGNFYTITGVREILFLEAGISIKEIKKYMNFDFSKVCGLLCTHEHKDHSKAVKDVVKLGVDCWMSKGTQEALEIEGHRISIVKSKESRDIGEEWKVLFLEAQHDCNEPLSFCILNKISGKKLLFATDTYYFKFKIHELNYIMIEANYDIDILEKNIADGVVSESRRNRIVTSHFEISRVKEFFLANDCSKLESVILIHLSDDNSDEVEFKKQIESVVDCNVCIAEN